MRKSSIRKAMGDRRSPITNLAKLLPQNRFDRKWKAVILVEEIAGKQDTKNEDQQQAQV